MTWLKNKKKYALAKKKCLLGLTPVSVKLLALFSDFSLELACFFYQKNNKMTMFNNKTIIC